MLGEKLFSMEVGTWEAWKSEVRGLEVGPESGWFDKLTTRIWGVGSGEVGSVLDILSYLRLLMTYPMKYLTRQLAIFYLLFFFAIAASAQKQISYHNLTIQTGDLIFVGAKKDQLSGAINRVTQREADVSFDHVGILEVEEAAVYILHASTEKGSVREPLDSLVSRAKSKDKQLVIYRLAEEAQAAIPDAVTVAKSLMDKPYNWTYVLNDSSLYCSDYVERAFRHTGLFRLEPMTFKNPKTGETDAYWVEFYKKLGMEVPEGQPGCNPNGLAASRHLQKLGELD